MASGELTLKSKRIAMKRHLLLLTLCGTLTGPAMLGDLIAQERKHEEQKEEKTASDKNATEPVKAESMKCCEGMDKMGEMKSDMKAKMAKMKEMKQKMAEKMGEKGMMVPAPDSKVEKKESSEDTHPH
jgi:hypothetical protein